MKHLAIAGLAFAIVSSTASAQINAGEQQPEPNLPFNITEITTLRLPWRIAFLPDGRMLITEKVGGLVLVTPQGAKTPVANVPPVLWEGQGGMLGVYLSPHYAQDHNVYLTYSEPGNGGSSLALARAQLNIGNGSASLEDLHVIWRDGERGEGGQFGAANRLLSRQQISLPLRRRQAAHDSGPGSQPAARQNPAPHARWQTGPW